MFVKYQGMPTRPWRTRARSTKPYPMVEEITRTLLQHLTTKASRRDRAIDAARRRKNAEARYAE